MAATVAWTLLGLGCFFLLTGAVGVLRFPDFLSRMHPAAKGDTAGQVLVLAGLAVQLAADGHSWQAVVKLVLISLVLFITTPTATHAMARSAHLAGPVPEEVPEEREEVEA